MRDYCNSDCHRAKFESSNEDLNFIFEAARETYRQNALDIYMDCPSRERAGWLCDSYFTGRVEFALSGKSRIERNFIENFLLPKEFKDIDKGMLPMCYPADHRNHNYIPNWAMWFVLEVEEYLERTGDIATIERARTRIYDVVNFFERYMNRDGLLEKLPKWVFVDYSFSNKCVQDISYPSNMLYAEMLDAVARIYGDNALAEQASHIRKVVLAQSYNGEFFVDNALLDRRGKVAPTENTTEACPLPLYGNAGKAGSPGKPGGYGVHAGAASLHRSRRCRQTPSVGQKACDPGAGSFFRNRRNHYRPQPENPGDPPQIQSPVDRTGFC